MAGFGSFLQGAFDYKLKEDQQNKEMAMYEKKLKLANELTLQLEQRKMELAKQNPTYSKFLQTSAGDVVGMDQFGNSKVLREADPQMKESLLLSRQAKMEEDKAKAEQARANAEYLRARKDNPELYWRPPSSTGGAPRDQLTANATVEAWRAYARENGTVDLLTKRVIPLPPTPENLEKFDRDVIKGLKLKTPGNITGVQPEVGVPEEDLDSLKQALGDYNLFME